MALIHISEKLNKTLELYSNQLDINKEKLISYVLKTFLSSNKINNIYHNDINIINLKKDDMHYLENKSKKHFMSVEKYVRYLILKNKRGL